MCDLWRLGGVWRGCPFTRFDNFAEHRYQDIAGLLAQHGDFGAAPGHRPDVRRGNGCRQVLEGLPGGKRPHRSFETVAPRAGGANRLLALLVQKPFGGGIHSRLSPQRLPQGQNIQIALQVGEPHGGHCRIKVVECLPELSSTGQGQAPTAPQCWCGFQTAVFAFVIE